MISWEETFQKSLSDTRKSATTSSQFAVKMVVSEFGRMTEFRWSAHFAGHNLKCAQISRKMDFLQQYNVNSGNWKFGYGGSCEVMRITPEFELEKFAQEIQFKIVWELNIYLRIAGICIQGFPVNYWYCDKGSFLPVIKCLKLEFLQLPEWQLIWIVVPTVKEVRKFHLVIAVHYLRIWTLLRIT